MCKSIHVYMGMYHVLKHAHMHVHISCVIHVVYTSIFGQAKVHIVLCGACTSVWVHAHWHVCMI